MNRSDHHRYFHNHQSLYHQSTSGMFTFTNSGLILGLDTIRFFKFIFCFCFFSNSTGTRNFRSFTDGLDFGGASKNSIFFSSEGNKEKANQDSQMN